LSRDVISDQMTKPVGRARRCLLFHLDTNSNIATAKLHANQPVVAGALWRGKAYASVMSKEVWCQVDPVNLTLRLHVKYKCCTNRTKN